MTAKKILKGFEELSVQDEQIMSALRDFRASAHAWSEAEYSRPRMAMSAAHRRAWRSSAIWAMSLVLAASVAGTGVYEHHREQVAAARQIQIQREMEQKQQLEAQKAKEAEELMAKIDSDISREVPSAMEPLAQLMDDTE